MAVRPARDSRRERAASKARSTAAAKRRDDGRLLAEGVHGAHGAQILRRVGRGVGQRSWAARDRRRTARP